MGEGALYADDSRDTDSRLEDAAARAADFRRARRGRAAAAGADAGAGGGGERQHGRRAL